MPAVEPFWTSSKIYTSNQGETQYQLARHEYKTQIINASLQDCVEQKTTSKGGRFSIEMGSSKKWCPTRLGYGTNIVCTFHKRHAKYTNEYMQIIFFIFFFIFYFYFIDFFFLCIFSQVRNIPERIILISTTGLR